MSILEPKKIDIVAVKPDSTVVKLVIADHLSWDDLKAHSLLLQDKINTYLEFVMSGQLQQLKEPKIPDSPEIRVTLSLQHSPTPEAKEFLAQVERFLKGSGLGFEIDQMQ